MEISEKEKEEMARENVLRKSEEAKGVGIHGYDFNSGVDY